MDSYSPQPPIPPPELTPPKPDIDQMIAQTAQTQLVRPPRRSKLPFIIIGIVVFLLLAGGVIAALLLPKSGIQTTNQPKPKPSGLDQTDPIKVANAYFLAIQKCDLKTVRSLSADKSQRDNPAGFTQNQLTDCQTNVEPLYKDLHFQFLSMQKKDNAATALFRSKDTPQIGDAIISLTQTDKNWYVSTFTPRSTTAVQTPTTPTPLANGPLADATLTANVDKLATALENYFDTHQGYYPTTANLVDPNWTNANLTGLDTAVFYYDSQKNQRINTVDGYRYETDTCDSVGSGCAAFVITVTLSDGGSYSKPSVNQ